MADLVRLERRDDGVAEITLDNPPVNALSIELLEGLRDAARSLAAEPPGAVVVTGGAKVFAAGADVSQFVPVDDPACSEAIGRAFTESLSALAAVPRAVIASVSGYALGGGCELALACDFRIASERAVFGQPEVLLGIIPGGGGTQRLARLIGPARAKDLVMTGRQVRAEEALHIGLVDEVVPKDEVLARTRERAAELAAGAVVAQGLAKQAVDRGLDLALADGVDLENELFRRSFTTEDARIGVESFLEDGPGKATFTGR